MQPEKSQCVCMGDYAIGIDIGATNLRVCCISSKVKLLWSEKKGLDKSSPPGSVLMQIKRIIKEHNSTEPISVGVAAAGFVSMKSNRILKIPNAGIGEIDPSKPIEEFLGVRPVVINDAVAAVISESLVEEKAVKDIVFITISTGIGGGIMSNGRVIAGSEGNAHEVGHIVVDYEGEMDCGCGGKGHWEAYCSGANLPKYIAKTAGRDGSLKDVGFDADQVFKLMRKGDKAIAGALDKAIRINAAGFASVINEFWPDLLVVGGALALSQWRSYIIPSLQAARELLSHGMPRYRKSFQGDIVSSYGAAIFSLSPSSFL